MEQLLGDKLRDHPEARRGRVESRNARQQDSRPRFPKLF
jgi:hypothetical protein